ncbi:leucine zipper protein 2-like [Meleagris gallopavo]|uniref:leucine zipper protein 2-like n=1 Tax=Meleagris gallopavo TaxID=9103 RepID=UPI0012AB9D46|nr:leucine zipper protein 2-like [Meleagris gallopavo]
MHIKKESQNCRFWKGPQEIIESNSPSKQNASAERESLHVASRKEENQSVQECDSQDVGKTCLGNYNNSTSRLKTAETETSLQMLRNPPWTKPEDKKSPEKNEKKFEDSVSTKEKKL